MQINVAQNYSKFTNKENYYAHWQKQHRITVIPDCLNIIYEEHKLKKRSIKLSTAKIQIQNCEKPIDYEILVLDYEIS